MEHRIKGQIGQPAACMIENKGKALSARRTRRIFGSGDYGAKACAHGATAACDAFKSRRSRQSTTTVDNIVGNGARHGGEPRECRRENRLPNL
jgi:hypothetical protein